MRIRKNDIVMAMSGDDSGRSGKVLEVLPAAERALVEGLNIVSKAMRKTKDRPEGGIVTREAPIKLCVLLPLCPVCKKGVRVKRAVVKGQKVRQCRHCAHQF
jgi:large subunit ribosomal protein L24